MLSKNQAAVRLNILTIGHRNLAQGLEQRDGAYASVGTNAHDGPRALGHRGELPRGTVI